MRISWFWKGFIFVLLAAILVSSLVFVNRILAGDAFSRQEAQHALYGVSIWRDISAGDWNNFWYDTGRQMVWPFLQSWLLSVVFFFFGVGYVSARTLSLVFFFASIIFIYLLSNELCDKKGHKVGILAVFLALTSPLMLKFATLNMIENLGALLFLAIAYLYMISEERKITIEYVILAILIGLTIYTNYLYAYLLIPAFLVMAFAKLGPLTVNAIKLRKKGEKEAVHFIWWAYRKLFLFAVLVVFCGIWFSFSFSRKLLLFFSSIFKFTGGTEVQGVWQHLIYYPKVIIADLSFSPWIGIFLLLSLFMPMFAARYRGLNRLYTYVWTVLLLLILTIPVKAPQMLYIIVPFIFIIFSGVIVAIFDQLREKNKTLAIGLIVVLMGPALFSIPKAYQLFFPLKTEENMVDVLNYFKQSVPDYAEVGTLLNLTRFNSDVVHFHFFVDSWDGHILTEDYLEQGEFRGDNNYLLTLEIDEASPYQKDIVDDSLYRWNALLKEKEMTGEIRPYTAKYFDDIGLTAKIYQSRSY